MWQKRRISAFSSSRTNKKKINIMCLIASSPSIYILISFVLLWVCASENFSFSRLMMRAYFSMVHELIDAALLHVSLNTHSQYSWIHHIHWIWNLWVVSVEAKENEWRKLWAWGVLFLPLSFLEMLCTWYQLLFSHNIQWNWSNPPLKDKCNVIFSLIIILEFIYF